MEAASSFGSWRARTLSATESANERTSHLGGIVHEATGKVQNLRWDSSAFFLTKPMRGWRRTETQGCRLISRFARGRA